MSDARASLIGECRMLFMTSIWLFCCLQYFLPFLAMLPIYFVPGVGVFVYRKLHAAYDKYGVVCTMTVPFSWCGFRIHYRNYEAFRAIKCGSDALVLSTHCSRVDWLIGTYLSVLNGHRVAFVAEATTALMPIIGWQRWLAGDIFVTRAFHQDGPRIASNVASYKASAISRLLFLAPEGFVADPGSAVGEAYLPQCDAFMAREGRPPLTHLLTPRYKGMQSFVQHAPRSVLSVAMAYVTDAVLEAHTGTLLGGSLLSRGLRDPQRVIPDLHTVFRGGLSVLIQGGFISLDASDPQKLKEQMLDDQQMKDTMMQLWQQSGHVLSDAQTAAYYSLDKPPSPMEEVARPHLWLNAYFFGHTAASALVLSILLRISYLSALVTLAYVVCGIACLHGSTHYGARLLTGSGSMESLCGETAIKAALGLCISAFKGVRNALVGKKSSKSSTKSRTQ